MFEINPLTIPEDTSSYKCTKQLQSVIVCMQSGSLDGGDVCLLLATFLPSVADVGRQQTQI